MLDKILDIIFPPVCGVCGRIDQNSLCKKCELQLKSQAVFGIDKKEVVNLVQRFGVRGVDRVVDIGDTMGLEFTWDGFRMIEAMSRTVYIYEDK